MFSYLFLFGTFFFAGAIEDVRTFSCYEEIKEETWPDDCFYILSSPRLSSAEKQVLERQLNQWCALHFRDLMVRELKAPSKRVVLPMNCSTLLEKNKRYQRFLRVLKNKFE